MKIEELQKNKAEEFKKRFGNIVKWIELNQKGEIVSGIRLEHFEGAILEDTAESIQEAYKLGREEEYKRCVDLLTFNHSKCPLPQTCMGYGNALSDLENQPPK